MRPILPGRAGQRSAVADGLVKLRAQNDEQVARSMRDWGLRRRR
jgi:hypothetical protein